MMPAAFYSLGGIRVVTSSACAVPGARVLYPDWRERLNRNLNRPSTGRWESLDYPDSRPSVYMIGDDWVVHPQRLAAMKNLGVVEGLSL